MTDDLIERLWAFVVERGKVACGSDIVSACNNSALSLSDLRALLGALEAAREDAARYRWLADNRCDVTMCASATDYGDGDTTFGPRVEIDPEQFGPEYGSPKAKLDAAIDAAREVHND